MQRTMENRRRLRARAKSILVCIANIANPITIPDVMKIIIVGDRPNMIPYETAKDSQSVIKPNKMKLVGSSVLSF